MLSKIAIIIASFLLSVLIIFYLFDLFLLLDLQSKQVFRSNELVLSIGFNKYSPRETSVGNQIVMDFMSAVVYGCFLLASVQLGREKREQLLWKNFTPLLFSTLFFLIFLVTFSDWREDRLRYCLRDLSGFCQLM